MNNSHSQRSGDRGLFCGAPSGVVTGAYGVVCTACWSWKVPLNTTTRVDVWDSAKHYDCVCVAHDKWLVVGANQSSTRFEWSSPPANGVGLRCNDGMFQNERGMHRRLSPTSHKQHESPLALRTHSTQRSELHELWLGVFLTVNAWNNIGTLSM